MVICILSVIYTFFFVLYVITDLTAITTNLYKVFMDFTSRVDEDASWKNHTVHFNLMQRFTSNSVASVVLSIWLLMAFGTEIIWVFFLILEISFAINQPHNFV